jgi:hypothetical protein
MKKKGLFWYCFIIVLFELNAQTGVHLSNPIFFQPTIKPNTIFQKNKYPKATKYTNIPKTPAQIPMAYCYNNLAFFCKIEVKIEKISFFPVKFRLGSVPYVDYLEQK